MFRTLRSQLLASYLAIIALTLTVAGVTLLAAFIIDAPLVRAYEELNPIAQTYQGALPVNETRREATLRTIAQANNIRTLRVTPDQRLMFDSAGRLPNGRIIPLRSNTLDEPQRGRFRVPQEGAVWVYVAMPPPQANPELGWTVYAQRLERGAFFAEFGTDIFRPMLQATLCGGIAAIVLALVVTRSVSRPLQHTAEAARNIADGDYTVRAPLSGPQEVRGVAVTFNHMAARVEKNQKAQRDFLASVSHDLKTPLTSIQGFAQAILDGAAADPARAASVIHDEATRMRRMVDELLDLARIESGMGSFTATPVDPQTIIDAVMNTLGPQAAQRDVDLTLHAEPGLPATIPADGDRLAQVFTNLLDNAITHANQRVSVILSPANGGVHITVRDDGPGIPEAEREHIFERFYQADRARTTSKRRGTGLGLTIVQEIVRAHGGRVAVQSELGHGTEFAVWLPA